MTDNPKRAVAKMRRQLELHQELDQEAIDAILAVDESKEIASLDLGLDDEDVMLLRNMGQTAREQVFGTNPADVEVLYEMSNTIQKLGPSKLGDHRHEFLLRRNFVLAKRVGGIADALEDSDVAGQLVSYINNEMNNSPETNKDYRTALRNFGDLLTDCDGPPPALEWIPGGYPKNYDPAPHPEEMYRWDEHIVPMLESCHNSRDRALVALAWDLGPRPGELYDLTLNRFSDHKYGMKVTLYRGKRGTRSPLIVPAIPYVRRWIEDHPAPEGSDAPLWVRVDRPTISSITNNRIRDIFKERARAADMIPPSTATPSRMRKSSASYLASQSDVSQQDLENHHGWARGSKVANRYIAVFADVHDRAIASAHGVDVEEDRPESKGPVPCIRCGEETPRHKDFCMNCGQPMSKEAAINADKTQQESTVTAAILAQEYDIPPEVVGQLTTKLVDSRLEELGYLDHASSSS